MKYTNQIIIFKAMIPVLFFAALCMVAVAPQAKPVKQTVLADRQVTGELLSLTPRNNPQMITVGVDAENADYMFYLAEDMNVVHKKKLSEIKVGDTVRVRYYIVEETDEKGRTYQKSIVQTVTFVRSPDTIKGLRSK